MENLPANLVALIYSPKHSSYPEITSQLMPGLNVDMEKMTWSYTIPGCRPNQRPPKKIGECDYFAKDNNSGVIGIYDRTKDEHLSSVARDWQETREAKNRNWNNVD